METEKKLTLTNLVNSITDNQLKNKKKNYIESINEFMLDRLLPDIYNFEKVNVGYYHEEYDLLYKNILNSANETNYMKSIRNRSYNTKKIEGTAKFIDNIMMNIYINETIVYEPKTKEDKKSSSQNVENEPTHFTIISNILTKMNKIIDEYKICDNLFKITDFVNKTNLPINALMDTCVNLIDKYKTEERIEYLEYLLFLLVLMALNQKDMIKYPGLYVNINLDMITQHKIIKNDNLENDLFETPKLQKTMDEVVNNPALVKFEDTDKKGYIGNFHVYVFKRTYERKYEKANLNFTMQIDNSFIVTLTFTDKSYAPNKRRKFTKIFKGTPLYNKTDQVIYILLESANGSFATMIFNYEDIKKQGYQSALLLWAYTLKKGPIIQKIIFSKNEIKDSKDIDGHLKMTNDTMVLSENSFNLLKQDIQNMEDDDLKKEKFNNIISVLAENASNQYQFDEDEIISYTNSISDKKTKLEIAKLLKSYTQTDYIIKCK